MTAGILLVADPERAALVAPSPGLAEVAEPGDVRGLTAPQVCVVFGDSPAPDAELLIRWTDREPPVDRVGRTAERVIAPSGEALWRRSPSPAADALFDLPTADPHAGVLVAGGPAGRRDELCNAIARRSVPVSAAPALTRAGLEGAAAVVLLPVQNGEALPAEAPAVLAARRLLVTAKTETAFGFIGNVHHLAFADTEEAADLVQSAHRLAYAYESVRAWGAYAAERHRASVVYARLLRDLELEGILGPSSNSSSAAFI